MADWSYANENLRDIKKYLSLGKKYIPSHIMKEILKSESFIYLSEQNFKDEVLCRNFINWCECITIEFVDADYKEEWGEGGARGNVLTLYSDFFIAFVSDYEDILSFMVHEYMHHICDRIFFGQAEEVKESLTIKERNFVEDMYINAWIEKELPYISDKWQSFLSNHDMFHGLVFSDDEESWNSLLTSNLIPCHNDLTKLYGDLRKDTRNFMSVVDFLAYATSWISILSNEKKTKDMINNLQINNEEWSHETCTPCEAEAKKRQEEKDTG